MAEKDEQHEPHQKSGWTQVLAKGRQFLSLVRHPHFTHIVEACLTPLSTNTHT